MIRRLYWLGRRRSRSRSPRPRRPSAANEPKTDPTKEFLLEPWIEIPKIGPFDLSITKAVFYLLLSTAILLIGTLLVVRQPASCSPKRLQAFVEIVYDFSETQIGRASLPAQDVHDVVPVPRHAVPLHLDQQHHLVPPAAGRHRAQDLGRDPDAELLRGDLEPLGHARADARDVLRLALRRHPAQRRRAATSRAGSRRSRGADQAFLIVPLEILSQFLRLVSLSVRLFANMLAGHLLDPDVRLADHHHRQRLRGRRERPGGGVLLLLRARARRQPAGVHLRHAVRHLHRRARPNRHH